MQPGQTESNESIAQELRELRKAIGEISSTLVALNQNLYQIANAFDEKKLYVSGEIHTLPQEY